MSARTLLIALLGLAAAAAPAHAASELGDVRADTADYHSGHPGYTLLRDAAGSACIDNPGQGGMGIHYVNGDLVGDGEVKATAPEALVYEPPPHGANGWSRSSLRAARLAVEAQPRRRLRRLEPARPLPHHLTADGSPARSGAPVSGCSAVLLPNGAEPEAPPRVAASASLRWSSPARNTSKPRLVDARSADDPTRRSSKRGGAAPPALVFGSSLPGPIPERDCTTPRGSLAPARAPV
jgi:hypothetical protein